VGLDEKYSLDKNNLRSTIFSSLIWKIGDFRWKGCVRILRTVAEIESKHTLSLSMIFENSSTVPPKIIQSITTIQLYQSASKLSLQHQEVIPKRLPGHFGHNPNHNASTVWISKEKPEEAQQYFF
jgi:hypothetical protein